MAVVQITLNKAFGFEQIDADVLPFLFAAAAIGTVDVPVKDRDAELQVRVSLGHYGRTQAEKQVLKDTALRHRAFDDIAPVPTLRIQFSRPLSTAVLEAAASEVIRGAAALALDDQIRQLMPIAKHAADQYYFGYRHFLLSKRLGTTCGWDEIAYEQKLFEPLTLRELSTYLFYEVRAPTGVRVALALGSSEGYSSTFLDSNAKRLARRAIRRGVAFQDRLYSDALTHLYDERYREAYLNLAVVLELALSNWIRQKMRSSSSLSETQVNRFIDDMSNRQLITVMVGYLSHADQDLLSDGRKVFEIRNGLAHGQKRSVSRAEVKTALGIIHRFRELFGRP
jgi:hypothetical protein